MRQYLILQRIEIKEKEITIEFLKNLHHQNKPFILIHKPYPQVHNTSCKKKLGIKQTCLQYEVRFI
jgi:hypothetical protein